MRKDVSWKTFFGDNERYADVINGIGCGGEQYVKPSDNCLWDEFRNYRY